MPINKFLCESFSGILNDYGIVRGMKALALALLIAFACIELLFAQDDSLAARSKEAHQNMNAGRYREAAIIYRGLVEEMPDEPRLRLDLGLALVKSGQPAEAIPELRKAVQDDARLGPHGSCSVLRMRSERSRGRRLHRCARPCIWILQTRKHYWSWQMLN